MAREKSTITLDRAKVEEARALVGGKSMSEVIDAALDRLIHAEHLKRDVLAYAAHPQTDEELVIADLAVTLDLGDDDVDYDAIYGGA
ncbi:MAG: type II toxin-antitoxin system VapB family antitoxin [Actinomycetota bacterium]|nr:type II toxin-antitoxin system VapB family antitoxin [Actinomycetota bacterium]